MNWNEIIKIANHGNLEPDTRVEKSDQEWEEILTSEQFRVVRMKGTERANSGEYCTSHESGKYDYVCCAIPLFDSSIKFDSGSGWPSFTDPIKQNAVGYIKDVSFGMIRVEAICNTCDAHLGHVFPDGPEPSGLRYCINSVSIKLLEA